MYGIQYEFGSSETTYQQIAQPTFNTPLLANPTSNGLLIEESRANRILWCRDATQSNWTKTNVTVAKTQTGVDNVANSASSLTASSANGTCIQTITLASGSRTGSVYLKRITGTGTIQVTLDGTTYSTVDLSTTDWRRIVLSGTVTNPTVGIKIVTSGDAVAMDFGQVEDGIFVTTPILTTTASVTRSADTASLIGNNFNGWFNPSAGTAVVNSLSSFALNASRFINTNFTIGFGVGVNNTFVATPQFGLVFIPLSNNTTAINATLYSPAGGGVYAGFSNIIPISTPVQKVAFSIITGTKMSASGYGFIGSTNNVNSNMAGYLNANMATIGSAWAISSGGFIGTVKQITYYPKCFSDDALITLGKL